MIIGTAGHVDHGKTTLIKALTGIDTDRLQEEKDRKLTIDLGFAPFDLPSGRRVGVIDVPGHEKFMGNMLAGIGGIDLVLLVVDANEGVMPQTREHFEVINLLKIKKALIVLTKIDLVESDWLDLVEDEIRDELKTTPYAGAEIVRISAINGTGVLELKQKIDEIIDSLEPKDSDIPLRIPVDRSFKIKGFGTVITGTLMTGRVDKDQQIEILPQGLKSRVRNIEVHNQPVETAYAGQRVALNLASVEKEEVQRGSIIVNPGTFSPTSRIDVELEVLADFPHTLKHASRVHFHLGTNDTLAKVYLFNRKEILPGEKAFAQIELDEPTVAHYQDLFIIRFFSPVRTMGGGRILNTKPGFYRKYSDQELEELQLLASGSNENLVLQKILHHGIISQSLLFKEVKLPELQLQKLINTLIEKGLIFELNQEFLMSSVRYSEWKEKILKRLQEFHLKNYLQPGYSKAELKQTLPDDLNTIKYDQFLNRLIETAKIRCEHHLVALYEFKPKPSKVDNARLEAIKKLFQEKGVETPDITELARILELEIEQVKTYIDYLIYLQELKSISDGYYLLTPVLNRVLMKVTEFLNENGEITLSEARDLLGSSRKYTLPIMEYFDEINLTKRKDNVRILV